MKVYVPATPDGLHPRTLPAILRAGYRPEVVPMLHLEAYYDLMVELWARAEDFCLVEHDIEVFDGVLEGLASCPELWCAHSYEVYAGDVAEAYGGPFALGCVRFRAELMERFPDTVVEAGKMDIHPVHPKRSYQVMDSTLTHWLRGPYATIGAPPVCHHRPAVVHHHAYQRVGVFPPFHSPALSG